MGEMVDATLVWTRGDTPHVLSGRVSSSGDERIRFQAAGGERPCPGERVILCLETPERARRLAQVLEVDGDEVVVRPRGSMTPDRRYYPRLDTQLALVYRVIDLGQAASSFSRRQQQVMKSWWRPASPEVNLSLNGLAFSSLLAIPGGAKLSLKLRLPDAPGVDHSLTGLVVRSVPENGPEGEGHHQLAVELTWMSRETHDALLRYVESWQTEALEQLAPAAAGGASAGSDAPGQGGSP